jgi:hypothetical protein
MDFRKELNCTFWGQDMVYADIDGGEAWGRQKQVSLILADYEKPLSVGTSIDVIDALIAKASG